MIAAVKFSHQLMWYWKGNNERFWHGFFGFLKGISAGRADGVAAERLAARGALLLPQLLYQAGVFHRLDRRLDVLCAVVDTRFQCPGHFSREYREPYF